MIALFQAATSDPKIQKELEGDITRVHKLGCLACRKPDAFGEIIQAQAQGDLKAIKELGERWIREASK